MLLWLIFPFFVVWWFNFIYLVWKSENIWTLEEPWLNLIWSETISFHLATVWGRFHNCSVSSDQTEKSRLNGLGVKASQGPAQTWFDNSRSGLFRVIQSQFHSKYDRSEGCTLNQLIVWLSFVLFTSRVNDDQDDDDDDYGSTFSI